jgi:hypothetical protein
MPSACASVDYIPERGGAGYRAPMGRWCLFFGLLLTCACAGGSDGDGDGDGGSGDMTCAPDEFAIEGSLDGEAVSHRGALSGYAWAQINTGRLDTSFEGGGSFHAEWQKLVADGQTFSATGNITLPAAGPHGAETLDYASGTFTKLDGGVRFQVSGFKLNVQCIMAPCPSGAVDGTLQGCAEP